MLLDILIFFLLAATFTKPNLISMFLVNSTNICTFKKDNPPRSLRFVFYRKYLFLHFFRYSAKCELIYACTNVQKDT